MTLSFQPKTEREILDLINPGVYDFQVVKAEDKVSKASGNPMIALTIVVWDEAGKEHILFDYLMPQIMYKVKHFCDAVGLEDKYNAGSFSSEDCMDKVGRAKITIQESDNYLPKNNIKDYVKADADKPVVIHPKEKHDAIDQDVPF